MKIKVAWVGRAKESFIKEGIRKYEKLISPFCKLELVEIKDTKDRDIGRAMAGDAEKIFRAVPEYTLLSDKGKQYTSVGFSEYLYKRSGGIFLIGGPFGVIESVTERAKDLISLSRMTFTHEMARVIFLEQVYRALTIINKRGYHH